MQTQKNKGRKASGVRKQPTRPPEDKRRAWVSYLSRTRGGGQEGLGPHNAHHGGENAHPERGEPCESVVRQEMSFAGILTPLCSGR
jgi:hypothetical protein